jgi:tRNA(Ile)-lysidine synthase TilS/MesJ
MRVNLYLPRVFRTIKKFKLIKNGDVVFVALSGGKDSASCLFALKKYITENKIEATLKGFHINFCLPISEKVQKVIEKQAKMAEVPLETLYIKDLGISLDEVRKKTNRPICSICGTLKRYLMNKIPREKGATKLATGHHMDDFLVFFFKNILGKNYFWISKFKPKADSFYTKILCKIRPLFMVGGKENKEFCKALGIPFIEEDVCPHTFFGCKIDINREKWYQTIYEIEKRHKDFRTQLISSIKDMSKFFEEKKSKIKECSICGEPTDQEICSYCKLFATSES